jgi:hypothetical protein
MQWLYATALKIFGHIKKGVHCLLKTAGSRKEAIRQNEIDFYIEKEEKMFFRYINYPIVLISRMIRTGDFQLPWEISFDKRMDLNDKIQFSILIRGRGLSPYFNPEDSPGSFGDKPGKRHPAFSFTCRNPVNRAKYCIFGTNRTEFGTHSKVHYNI